MSIQFDCRDDYDPTGCSSVVKCSLPLGTRQLLNFEALNNEFMFSHAWLISPTQCHCMLFCHLFCFVSVLLNIVFHY